MEPLSEPHVLVGKSAFSQLARPSNPCCHSSEKTEVEFFLFCRGFGLCSRMQFSVILEISEGGDVTSPPVVVYETKLQLLIPAATSYY